MVDIVSSGVNIEYRKKGTQAVTAARPEPVEVLDSPPPGHGVTKKEVVYLDLKKRIVTGKLPPGQLLGERSLTEEFKTSKTPIREALQQLERQGLVVNIPRKGTFVSPITVDDIREVFEIREIVECGAARLAALRHDPDQLRDLYEEYKKLLQAGRSKAQKALVMGEMVHSFIFRSIGNKRLETAYRTISDHVNRLRIHFVSQYGWIRLEQIHREHMRIIEALRSGDPEETAEAMRIHIRSSVEHIKQLI